jgi:hypothetical protein
MTDEAHAGTKSSAKPADKPPERPAASVPPKVPRLRAEMERLVEAETRERPKTRDDA